QARPEVDDPCPAPAGVAAAMAQPPFERHAGGLREIGRAARSDLIPGGEREQLRYVSVAGLGFVIVLEPFLNLAMATDFQGRKLRSRGAQARAELRIDTQNLA